MFHILFSFLLLISCSALPMCNPCSWMCAFVAIPWDKLTDSSLKQSALLYEAIQKNDFEQFKALLANRATFKYTHPETGNTIMQELIKPKNIDYLKYVHQKGLLFSSKKNAPSFWPNERGYANLETTYKYDNTLLHNACSYGNIEAIQLLIDYQVDLHKPSEDGNIPLFLSIQHKNNRVLDLFKNNSNEEEWKKVCTEHQNKQGNNLIHIICKNGSAEQAKYILDAFPNLLNQKNIDDQTPLHFAVIYDNHCLFNVLLDCKDLDVTVKDVTGDTAAMYALYRNDIDVFKKIITYDKKAINIGNKNGETPLHYLIKFKENESELIELATLLIKDGANLSIKDKDGNTPLHYAVMQQNKELVDLIIKKNPTVEKITNNNNETPFQIACNQQWKGGKEYFLTHCPKQNQYITDLFKTEKIDYVFCEKMLQQNPDHAYTKDAQGNTPLLIATERNDLKGIKLLLQYAPNTANIVNAKKDTPLHLLLNKLQKSINTETQNEIIDLLLSHTNLIDPATNTLVRNENGDSLLDLALYNTQLTIDILNKLPDNAKAINEPHPKTGFSPFLTACKNGNIELVTLFAKGDKADLEQKVGTANYLLNGYTPLLLAATGGHKNVYNFLIAQGCKQKVYTPDGYNLATLVIINYKDLDLQGSELKRLIKTYPEMISQTTTQHGTNLLHFAIWYNNKNAYTLLAQQYPNMIHEQNNNGHSPVHYAIEQKNTHALSVMKPTQNMPKDVLDTANYLFDALKTKDLTIIELFAIPELINKRHTKNGFTALQYAIKHTPYKKYIELLIKRGANPKIKSSDNKDTLEICLAHPNHDIFDLVLQSYSPLELTALTQKTVVLKDNYFFEKLLEKMSSVDRVAFFRQPIENKNCFLEYAIDNKLTDKITVALKQGLNPNEHFADGTLPLHYAIKKGNNELCKLLHNYKASLFDTDNQGYNALMLSIIHHQDTITSYLLTKPYNINHKTKDGESLLHIAAKHASNDIFQKIVHKHPHVNEQDVYGNTPLHIAAQQGNIENVTLLLKYSPNVHVQNKAGENVLTAIKNAQDRACYFDQYKYDTIYNLVHEKIIHKEKAQQEVDELYNTVTLLQKQNHALVDDIKNCDPTLWNTSIYIPTSFVYTANTQKETISSDDLKRRKEALQKQKTKEEQYAKVLQEVWQKKCHPYYAPQQPAPSNIVEPSAPPMSQEELQAYQDELNKTYQQEQKQQDWQHVQQQYGYQQKQ